ncbi:CDP-glycerol glycerophosphotransferase family protein [Fructilactobacillus myrtifloralis]|uniref:CDP-glycerol glycerophosphotransferase family protein n=1 Tax=Fructilactobacillus myrtifloralis TaxID=2940301 RepID=A0ABY5BPB0_9LACO|nr:CDP-glycerol glycerophosphotransferase family protein [Fructilactobacillus myrtifloralis]USS85400.1 CDP-glycerol glycerophosphotransferase family protein [Fructilactobacillus myrtifloralis]
MKTVYVWLVRFLSVLFYFRTKKNVYYLMSYSNNLHMIKRTAAELPAGQKLVVIYNPRTLAAAYDLKAFGVKAIPLKMSIPFLLQRIPQLMSARLIFCDNYYALLAGLIRPRTKMKIIQLWHADGTIKTFGWEDPNQRQNGWLKRRRHQLVYNQFDDYVVASKAMGNVFQRSFAQPAAKMQDLGMPRSDRLFSANWLDTVRQRVWLAAPELKNKRVILYAPTYRNASQVNPPTGTIEALAADPNAVVAVKLYPEIDREKLEMEQFKHPNVKIYDEFTTTDLMTLADTLVTDYSSFIFDFSLMPQARSAIFFMYDLHEYAEQRGVQPDLKRWLPTPPVKTVDQLRQAILANQPVDFTAFNDWWNTYNDGKAYKRVIDKYVIGRHNAAEDNDE